MTVTAKDLLETARKINSQADCNADWRAVVSRSYYAVYQDCDLFHRNLASPGSLNPNSKGGIHQNLIEQLTNPTTNVKEKDFLSRRIGYMMRTLFASRVKADYHREESITKEIAENSLCLAEKIVDLVNPPKKSAYGEMRRIK